MYCFLNLLLVYTGTLCFIDIKEKITLILHPVMSNYSFMAGRMYDPDVAHELSESFMLNEQTFEISFTI